MISAILALTVSASFIISKPVLSLTEMDKAMIIAGIPEFTRICAEGTVTNEMIRHRAFQNLKLEVNFDDGTIDLYDEEDKKAWRCSPTSILPVEFDPWEDEGSDQG